MWLMVVADEICDQSECRFVVGEDRVLPCVMYRVVVFECVSTFVHEEDARHVSACERVVVAVVGKFLSVESLEISLFSIDLLEDGESRHSFVAYFAILLWIVVRDHVEVDEILDLT